MSLDATLGEAALYSGMGHNYAHGQGWAFSRLLVPCVLCLSLLLSACDFRFALADDYSAAQEAAASQDWAQAARLLQRYLRNEIDPEKRWSAWNLLIEASRNMGEASWITDYLESMLLEFGDDELRSGQVLRHLAEVYERRRQWDRGVAVWKRLLETEELAPGEVAAIYGRMGQMYQHNLEFDQARRMYGLCVDNADFPAVLSECLYGIADSLSAEGKLSDALLYIDRVLQVRAAPGEILGMAHMLRGDIYQQQEQDDQARQAFRQALPLHPNPPAVETRLKALESKEAEP